MQSQRRGREPIQISMTGIAETATIPITLKLDHNTGNLEISDARPQHVQITVNLGTIVLRGNGHRLNIRENLGTVMIRGTGNTCYIHRGEKAKILGERNTAPDPIPSFNGSWPQEPQPVRNSPVIANRVSNTSPSRNPFLDSSEETTPNRLVPPSNPPAPARLVPNPFITDPEIRILPSFMQIRAQSVLPSIQPGTTIGRYLNPFLDDFPEIPRSNLPITTHQQARPPITSPFIPPQGTNPFVLTNPFESDIVVGRGITPNRPSVHLPHRFVQNPRPNTALDFMNTIFPNRTPSSLPSEPINSDDESDDWEDLPRGGREPSLFPMLSRRLLETIRREDHPGLIHCPNGDFIPIIRHPRNSVRASFVSFDCTICCEACDTRDNEAKLNCNHEFHFECINRWIGQNGKCPICRTAVIEVTCHEPAPNILPPVQVNEERSSLRAHRLQEHRRLEGRSNSIPRRSRNPYQTSSIRSMSSRRTSVHSHFSD